MKYCRIQLKNPSSCWDLPLWTSIPHSLFTEQSNTRVFCRCRRRDLVISRSSHFVRCTHLVESSESPAFLGSSELFCSSSRAASFSADSDPPTPSLAAGPDGPGKEKSEVPAHSAGAAVCMIFWRTSRIFSCKHTLVGKISEYRAWNAAVAWAMDETYTENTERLDRAFYAWAQRNLIRDLFQSLQAEKWRTILLVTAQTWFWVCLKYNVLKNGCSTQFPSDCVICKD